MAKSGSGGKASVGGGGTGRGRPPPRPPGGGRGKKAGPVKRGAAKKAKGRPTAKKGTTRKKR
jgi:hypothetical protein